MLIGLHVEAESITEADREHAEWRKSYYKLIETVKPATAKKMIAEQYHVATSTVSEVFRETYGRVR